ncbi:tripartite motif-containing protein 2 isoform X1 [Strongylocentrotus purpuratus]|uniref:Uncharacterized protein n=2 Tax=Strongylocentrotus purpuratus TaxID=7668 RepID=A0A7M7NKF8_STRPU|nr:tripartite motif-containing protein 2 isoform X1 [Strongylocentrotus purpuratus]XP_030837062.1 tripartite motif-containing protein 2 isoform X1 [Strongylocentrotus purpuratus]
MQATEQITRGRCFLRGSDDTAITMASQSPVVKQIDKQFLVCGICLDRYKVPKVLPCLHTFCQNCLENYVPSESLTLTCPLCRQQSIVPERGVAGLQSNFFITNLMEVLERPESNGGGDSPIGDQMLSCASHEGEPLTYYCDNCETAICEECTITEHCDHSTVLLANVIEEHKETLRKILEEAKTQIPQLKDAIAKVTSISSRLSEKKVKAESQISESFGNLEEEVRERKTEMIKELDTVHSAKQSVLQRQRSLLEESLNSIENNCDFTEQALASDNETHVLLVKKQMLSRLQELSQLTMQLKPEENDYINVSCDIDSIQKSIANIGLVQSNSAVPHESVASGEGLKRAVIGDQTAVTITTKNSRGILVKTGNAPLSAQLRTPDAKVDDLPIMDNRNGTYDVIFTVQKEGSHSLVIKLFDEHIRGSPFKLKGCKDDGSTTPKSPSGKIPVRTSVRQKATRRPASASGNIRTFRSNNPIEDDLILTIGTHGRNKGEFTNPQGITSTASGRILVTDSNNQCIQGFNSSGEVKQRFGVRGRSNGQLQRPTGIAVSHNGNYIVADYENKWISNFSPEGKFINKIGTGKLVAPKGVAVDNNNNIIVVDNRASTIFIFSPSGKVLNKIGSRGAQDQQLCGPHFVAVNKDNHIIVSDFHNHCIKIFDIDGQLITSFGSRGEGNGQFNAPTGVAVDNLGNIIVADWGNSRLQVFDSSGSFVSYINTMGDPLYGPQDICITSDGHVAVADSGNHCVKVYKYLQ